MAIGPQVFVAQPFARKTKLHITAPTVVKASAGFIGTVAIVAPPSAAGGVSAAGSRSLDWEPGEWFPPVEKGFPSPW